MQVQTRSLEGWIAEVDGEEVVEESQQRELKGKEDRLREWVPSEERTSTGVDLKAKKVTTLLLKQLPQTKEEWSEFLRSLRLFSQEYPKGLSGERDSRGNWKWEVTREATRGEGWTLQSLKALREAAEKQLDTSFVEDSEVQKALESSDAPKSSGHQSQKEESVVSSFIDDPRIQNIIKPSPPPQLRPFTLEEVVIHQGKDLLAESFGTEEVRTLTEKKVKKILENKSTDRPEKALTDLWQWIIEEHCWKEREKSYECRISASWEDLTPFSLRCFLKALNQIEDPILLHWSFKDVDLDEEFFQCLGSLHVDHLVIYDMVIAEKKEEGVTAEEFAFLCEQLRKNEHLSTLSLAYSKLGKSEEETLMKFAKEKGIGLSLRESTLDAVIRELDELGRDIDGLIQSALRVLSCWTRFDSHLA